MNKFSRHLTHHLYQYDILTDHLSKYLDSDESHFDRSAPKYAKAASKYKTSLHIIPASLDNFPNNNSSRSNFYARSKKSRNFGGCVAAISANYCSAGRFCVHAFNHSYRVTFIKTQEQPRSCMWCTFRCHEICSREIFPKFMCIPQRYLCSNCYSVF